MGHVDVEADLGEWAGDLHGWEQNQLGMQTGGQNDDFGSYPERMENPKRDQPEDRRWSLAGDSWCRLHRHTNVQWISFCKYHRRALPCHILPSSCDKPDTRPGFDIF